MDVLNLDHIKNYFKIIYKFRAFIPENATPPLFIGYGRNISINGITKEEANYLLNNDIKQVIDDLNKKLPWWINCTYSVQRALINMGFNLGIDGLLKFNITLGFLKNHEYKLAAENVLKSKWAEQVKSRAYRIKDLIAFPETDNCLSLPQLIDDLNRDEGFSSVSYICPGGKWTIGIGRNLVNTGITEVEADYLLQNDLQHNLFYLKNFIEQSPSLTNTPKHQLISKHFRGLINKSSPINLILNPSSSLSLTLEN